MHPRSVAVVTASTRRLAELRAPEVAERVSARSIIVQPLGAIEQHGPHLPFDTDLVVATEVADATVAEVGDALLRQPPDVLPPLLAGGAAVPEVAPLLGVAAPELPGDVYACPATAAVAGCAAVALPPRCAKSYAIAPPKARVAMTFTVMKMIATRSRMGRLP